MARYQANHHETGAWLRSGPQLRDAVRDEAQRRANRARAIAPVDTGRYKAGIRVTDSRGWDGRLAADVEATAAHSAAVEWGNARTGGRGHHVLRRAADG